MDLRKLFSFIVAIAAAMAATPAVTQDASDENEAAPRPLEITVTRPRLDEGLPGAAVAVLRAEDIAQAPIRNLPELLGQAAGVQSRNLYGGVAGARATVDLRGFGATGAQNTLVLVNGRRLNDIDIAAVEFVNVPIFSIERVEIFRGNSAAVLYGDGAVGGAINIVTRPSAVFSRANIGAALGSYGLRQANASGVRASMGWSLGIDTNATFSDGYRVNNELRQRGFVVNARRFVAGGEWFLRSTVDAQHLGLPGARRVTDTTSEIDMDPRTAATPNDFSSQTGHRTILGMSRRLAGGSELVIDGGLRVKAQDSVVISAWGPANDTTTNTRLSTVSLTPRIRTASGIFGVDYIYSDYNQIARTGTGVTPTHRYDLKQHSMAAYGQNTLRFQPSLRVAIGGRLQQTRFNGGDVLDPNATIRFGESLYDGHRETEIHWDTSWAGHVGLDWDATPAATVFLRSGRSFRAPTVDERVLSTDAYNSFRLRTQTSWDVEGGIRWNRGGASGEFRLWLMNMSNELHFNAATFLNVNLDPTRRIGAEANAVVTLAEDWTLNFELAWIRARFREGLHEGKDLPLVSPWNGSATLNWMMRPGITLAGTLHGTTSKWMDNDDANAGRKIPGTIMADVHITGSRGPWSGSLLVNNLLDRQHFSYAVASTSTPTTYNAYPLGGRTMRLELRRRF